MGDHFRLRKASDLQTAERTEMRTHLKVIHAISFLSILLAALSVGLSLYNSSKISTGDEETTFTLNEKKPTKEFDKYRGYKKVKGEALGYFSLQKTDAGKWSLVTPEGNAFFAMAVNKVYPYNIEKDVYKEKFASDTEWAKSATTLLDTIQFNTLGNSAQLTSLIQPKVLRFPFTLSASYVKWESAERIAEDDFPDVWSETYLSDVDIKTKKMSKEYGSDPYAVLMWPANELHFNLQDVNGNADAASVYWKKLLEEEGQTPAKKVWVGLYQTRYNNDIAAVNTVYGTTMTTFDDMYALGIGLYNRFTTIEEGEETDGQKAYADIDDWSTEIAKQFHKVAYEAVKKYMPHMIMTSERLVQANHSPLFFEKIKPYIDALAVNLYMTEEQIAPRTETLDRYAALVDNKPLVISEHTFAEAPCGLSDGGGTYPEVADQAIRATAHFAYRNSIVEHPSVTYLGFHEYTDVRSETNTCGYTNFGLVSRQAEPYDEMISAGTENWIGFNKLRWQDEALVNATEVTNPKVPNDTNTNKVTNTNTGKAPSPPVTNTNTAAKPKTNTNTAANPITDVGKILKPITDTTTGKNLPTNTNTAANPLTNTDTAPNRATQTDVSFNLPDYTDGVSDVLPKGPTLAGFFAAPAKEPVTPLFPNAVDTSNWKTYTDVTYNYTLKYPTDWTVSKVEKNDPNLGKVEYVSFTSPKQPYILNVSVRKKGSTQVFTDYQTPTGGDFEEGFVVTIGDISAVSSKLLVDGKTKSIFYPTTSGGVDVATGYEAHGEFTYGDIDTSSYASLDMTTLPERKSAEAILGTLRFTAR